MDFNLTTILSSWPPWIAVMVIVVVLILRGSLVALVNRAHRVRLPLGTSVDASVQPPQVPRPSELLPKEVERGGAQLDPRAATDELLRHLPRTEYITLREQQLDEELKRIGVDADSEQKARALLAMTALTAVSTEFERLYSVILGSQIKVLQALNSVRLSPEKVRLFYDEAASAYPEFFKTYAFERWLGFLSDQGVIEVKPDYVGITLKGRALLTYIAHEGKSFERAG